MLFRSDSVPLTLGDLEAACEKLQAAGITPISSNYAEWYQSGMFSSPL